jgi:hypothetical protein
LIWTTDQGQNNSVIAGEKWIASITGAVPNANVILVMVKDGYQAQIPVGFTDANGFFQYSSIVDGNAYQTVIAFYVNGVFVGTFTLFLRTAIPMTSTGMPVPSPTVQPGVVPVPSSSPGSMTVVPSATPIISTDPGAYIYQTAPAHIPPGVVTPWNI